MADEWIDVVNKLWLSWEPGAVVDDKENTMYVDPAKVHPIHHEGRFFPVARSAQHRFRGRRGGP